MSTASFSCWAQAVPAPSTAYISLPGPSKPDCGANTHPGFSHEQMEAICDADIAFLKERRKELLLDTKSHRRAVVELDKLLRFYVWARREERIMLGQDPGPDLGPGRPRHHAPGFPSIGRLGGEFGGEALRPDDEPKSNWAGPVVGQPLFASLDPLSRNRYRND